MIFGNRRNEPYITGNIMPQLAVGAVVVYNEAQLVE